MTHTLVGTSLVPCTTQPPTKSKLEEETGEGSLDQTSREHRERVIEPSRSGSRGTFIKTLLPNALFHFGERQERNQLLPSLVK